MARLIFALFVVLFAASARAQSPYVAGTIGADVTRVSHTDSNFTSSSSGGNETLSGSLRVGTAIGQNWGAELEFVHSARSHEQTSPRVLPLATSNPVTTTPVSIGGVTLSPVAVGTIPTVIPFQTDVRQSHSDFDAAVWVRQSAGSAVDLVYLGGIAFSRERVEITQNFPTGVRLLAPVPNGGFRTTVINYGTRPLAGIEARVRLTSHVRLIPGLRLQGIADGWLMRPYAGLGWFF
jgi:hypothetical protein